MSTDVGAVADFAERSVELVELGRGRIGIIRWRDKFYGISNMCSHQGGPLCRGVLSAHITAAEPGKLAVDESVPLLACPWHGWEFDVRTGRALLDPKRRVRTYAVRVAGDRVLVETSGSQATDEV